MGPRPQECRGGRPRAEIATPQGHQVWTPEQLGAFVASSSAVIASLPSGSSSSQLVCDEESWPGSAWSDVDLVHETGLSPTTPRVVVAGHAHESEAEDHERRKKAGARPGHGRCTTRLPLNLWAQERDALGQSTQLLFVWPSGRPSIPTITALFHRHCHAAGLPRIRLHDVRHSYATAALLAGAPPRVVSERLGHSSVAFTQQVYTQVIPGMDRSVAKQVAALILGSQSSANRDGRIWVAWEAETERKQNWPGTKPRPAVVAGAGFEPATSGRDRALRRGSEDPESPRVYAERPRGPLRSVTEPGGSSRTVSGRFVATLRIPFAARIRGIHIRPRGGSRTRTRAQHFRSVSRVPEWRCTPRR